jgi:hypothetical protein
VPQRRNPVRAWHVQSNSSGLFRASKIVDGWFRQLERLVRPRLESIVVSQLDGNARGEGEPEFAAIIIR